MPKKKIKQPSASEGKKIKTRSSDKKPLSQIYPVFSFYNISSSYSLKKCDPKTKINLIEKLNVLGAEKWVTLHGWDKSKGLEPIARSCLNPQIPDYVTKDLTIYSFRIESSSLGRVLGYRCSDGIFHIVWIDPKGKTYKH